MAYTSTESLGFAPIEDQPVPYMSRTREWYLTLGFNNPYEWAHYIEVPFQPLRKPLSESTVTLITTAAPYQPDKGLQGPGASYNAAAKFYKVYSGEMDRDHDVRIAHVGIDFDHTSMEDSGTWFPLPALRAMGSRIGRLARRFHGVPTNRSQMHTLNFDCPDVLERCREDGVDVAILIPNCPICHQTLSLVARHLESNGIATIVMGCAKDIVEYCGVPRFLFSDFPLGNSVGRPHDKRSQTDTLELALRVLETAPGPRTTVQNPIRWNSDPTWKLSYSNIRLKTPEEVEQLKIESHREREVVREIREKALLKEGAR